ncbi:UDP-N-acetylmuramoyl-L-alanyl-D-glutamate--2,6-diaminopimelate ligase [Paenibacillus sp. YYML68]|uniref:UDP-N-acetylmuramoyl-L-alanyl-D-glutamate--2, 6-diaminopimelate ligase n=1 Tax=Paenibacillus sp. YYML68 TaxID=2909250 RepID=UPI00249030A6|nr:UDP-N-acetylmuramoyl-L-alanyl-D-glutamate--2,6-diaminopimelate ligase [Paenibacillus sp. YYML68]
MQLQELADQLVTGRLMGNGDIDITGLTTDSRKVKSGDLFLCMPGFTVDGHDYAAAAVERGAAALVVERELHSGVPELVVPDARYAAAVLAAHFYQYPSQEVQIIGVTGTNGKTTTTYIIERILSDQGYRTGLMGNIHVKVGDEFRENKATNTQETVELQRILREMADLGTDYCVMEVSSHGLDLGRVMGCRFRTGIFTNLTQDHLDYHGTMERYREAKSLLFSRMGNGFAAGAAQKQYAVLNADDSATAYFRGVTPAQVITYGIDDERADVRASDIRMTALGTDFECVTSFRGSFPVSMRLVGRFNVYNALGAIAALLAERLEPEAIAASLGRIQSVEGRMEVVDAGQPFLVLVDYAHTPDGLENALSTIRQFAAGRVWCVFGCGGDRDRAKRPLMGAIAAKYSDYCIVTSDNPRTEDPERILLDIEPGLLQAGWDRSRYELMADRRAAIARVMNAASEGDVVLIAGKGHETYQEIQGVKHPFDDREIAKQAIRGR